RPRQSVALVVSLPSHNVGSVVCKVKQLDKICSIVLHVSIEESNSVTFRNPDTFSQSNCLPTIASQIQYPKRLAFHLHRLCDLKGLVSAPVVHNDNLRVVLSLSHYV